MSEVVMDIQKDFNTVFGPPDMYRRLVENLHAGIYVADAKGRLVYVNHAFAYLLGYSSKDELIGLNLADHLYVHPEDRRKFLGKIEEAGFVRDYEVQNRRKDGTVVILSVTSNVIYDEANKMAGIEGVIDDITSRRKLLDRLYIFEKAVEQTADHVMITDKQGVIQYVNPAFEITTGFDRDEVVGSTPKILQSGKQSRDYYRRLWETILAGETFYAQTTNKKKNGELYVADQTVSPIVNEAREITHFVSVWKDITERVRLEESLKNEKRKLEEIVGFDEKICSIRKSDRLMDFVVTKTMSILEAKKCSIMFIDDEQEELYLKAASGFEMQSERVKIKDSMASKVIEDGQPVLVKKVFPQMHTTHEDSYAAYSFMIAPIKRDGKIIGVINVADKQGHFDERHSFDELDLKILGDIAREVAVALENVRFYKELQFLTIIDPVTNIYNHRHFSSSLDYEIKRLQRMPGDLALLMLDIDNFKSYNDKFGHLFGDKMLKDLGGILKKVLRDTDIICRYAGDEFVVILPGTDKPGSVFLGERIRKAIAEEFNKHAVTVSIGVAKYKAGMSARELIIKADRALYKAKKDGKNRICFSGR